MSSLAGQVHEDYPAPILPGRIEPGEEVEKMFRLLADKWRDETAYSSLALKKAMHPAYQRIIGMGPNAIPLILRELEQNPSHWFWALNAITGEDPAQPDDNIDQAAEAWLRWGREKGYL
ncbi:MAG: hypothetical protein ACREEM_47050 [Blastocatellia bacterium]